jgi:hypothetical protein
LPNEELVVSAEEAMKHEIELLEAEFEEVLPKYIYQSMSVDWNQEFPGLGIPAIKKDVDPITHLRKVPLGKLIQKWIAATPTRNVFGYLPFMATHSRASVGSLLASSYCERVNSAGKLIFNDSNASLSPVQMDMLATLRMPGIYGVHAQTLLTHCQPAV